MALAKQPVAAAVAAPSPTYTDDIARTYPRKSFV
jgi:hypothetical protein